MKDVLRFIWGIIKIFAGWYWFNKEYFEDNCFDFMSICFMIASAMMVVDGIGIINKAIE